MLTYKKQILGLRVVGNGDYPEIGLKLRQNSEFKIFKFCFLEFLS